MSVEHPPDSSAEETAYDSFHYVSHPYAQSQPTRLAGTAKLFGLTPPPPQTARVLELGCALGGNSIPLAEQYPNASFVGIDISGEQIRVCNARVAELGLTNIEFRKMDIAKPAADLGKFDYIIAHGVFSWVPVAIQTAIFALCRDHLTENGVAYVSYNVYPGWHKKTMSRDLMMFHAEQFTDETQQVHEGRALLGQVGKFVDGAYGEAMRTEADSLSKFNDSYIRHDHLETNNHPIYFIEFVANAKEHGLSYLCESDPTTALLDSFETSMAERLRTLGRGNVVLMEQYLDFFLGRQFRMTLLVHAAAEAKLVRTLSAASVADLHWLPRAQIFRIHRPISNALPNVQTRHAVFKSINDEIVVDQPLQIEALSVLERMGYTEPSTITAQALAARAAKVEVATASDIGIIQELLLELFRRKLLWCFGAPIHCAPVTEYPQTRAVAIADAQAGRSSTTNLIHEKIFLADEQIRLFIPLLNGKNSHTDLEAKVKELFVAGRLNLTIDGKEIGPEHDIDEVSRAHVAFWLDTFAKLKMLVPAT